MKKRQKLIGEQRNVRTDEVDDEVAAVAEPDAALRVADDDLLDPWFSCSRKVKCSAVNMEHLAKSIKLQAKPISFSEIISSKEALDRYVESQDGERNMNRKVAGFLFPEDNGVVTDAVRNLPLLEKARRCLHINAYDIAQDDIDWLKELKEFEDSSLITDVIARNYICNIRASIDIVITHYDSSFRNAGISEKDLKDALEKTKEIIKPLLMAHSSGIKRKFIQTMEIPSRAEVWIAKVQIVSNHLWDLLGIFRPSEFTSD